MPKYCDVKPILHLLADKDLLDTVNVGAVLQALQHGLYNGEVRPVVHAHWIRWKEPKVTNPVYRCSNCGFDITVDKHPNVSIGFWIFDFRYCLHCGAKMDEEVE